MQKRSETVITSFDKDDLKADGLGLLILGEGSTKKECLWARVLTKGFDYEGDGGKGEGGGWKRLKQTFNNNTVY